LVELHEHAARFFLDELHSTREGKLVRDYLHDRGLSDELIKAFGIGYAPGAGDALVRRLKQAGYAQELIDASGLANKDERGTVYDRFRRRVMFPIHSESGRLVGFGGRAMGDEMPKYLNSPETPIYSKSRVLYNLHRAKDAVRKQNYAVLVEGYLDCIGAHTAGVANVVASCGTSLTPEQVRLLGRSTHNVVVNFDPDAAGVAATERSLNLLLEQGFQVRVLALPAGTDPDSFVREQGAAAYREKLKESKPYLEYLAERARREYDARSQEGKIAALNFLLPYLARVPNKIRRAEWAAELSARLAIDEALVREELRRAAQERRGEIRLRPEAKAIVESRTFGTRPAERRLVQILLDNPAIRADILKEMEDAGAHRGAGLETIFNEVLAMARAEAAITSATLAERLPEAEQRLVYELAFEEKGQSAGTLEEARSCLAAMQRRRLEAELRAVQQQIQEAERAKDSRALRDLLSRKQQLRQGLAELG
jgi:DNA primase